MTEKQRRNVTISYVKSEAPEGVATFPSVFGTLTLEKGLTKREPAPDGREPVLMRSKKKYR